MAQTRSASSTTKHGAGNATPAVIGAGTRVRGRLTGDGDVTILGHLEGGVQVRGELFIGEGGRVVSDVDAGALRVAGVLEGDVSVTGDVEILAGAKVRGDLRGAHVSLEEGADLEGRLDCEFQLPSELEAGGTSAKARR
jgi:cytoskeletal protein CcmA (bactofilin family)